LDLGSLPKLAGLLMLVLSLVTLFRFSSCSLTDGDAIEHGSASVDGPRSGSVARPIDAPR
jgi:hypothetical protein